MAIKQLWFDKYRPKTLDEYIFQDEQQKAKITQMVTSGEVPHLMLTGVQGSGKTALTKILIDSLGIDEMDLMEVDASKKNSVEFVRDELIPFCETLPMGRLKIVHLAEFDYMSQAAQGTLRETLGGDTSTFRFIATCNYENRIIPALRSRFQVMRFKALNEDEIFIQLVNMLDAESVQFEPEVIFTYIKQAYPDVRQMINNIEFNVVDKVLQAPKASGSGADYKFKVLDLLAAGDFEAIYGLILKQVPAEDIEGVYEFLWQNLNLIPQCKASKETYRKVVLLIADALRAHAVAAFPHVTFQALCIRIIMAIS